MPIGGAVYQDVYIRSITPDFVMTITDVRLVCPDGGYAWWPTCAINGCLLDKESIVSISISDPPMYRIHGFLNP